jgi:Ser/Thr protein kinase RdoA (MazF antagonist)
MLPSGCTTPDKADDSWVFQCSRARGLMEIDLTRWPITPRALERIGPGVNNETYAVEAAEGAFVLRIYRNAAEPEAVRPEHELLGRLALIDLPFEIPRLVAGREGDTIVVLETPDGPALAALFHRIAGAPPPIDPPHARAAAAALARLDIALAAIDQSIGRAWVSPRNVHPLVDDPAAALDDLDLGQDADAIRASLEQVDFEEHPLVASLPRQIIHGDFGLSNTLVRNGRVVGVVDFEFAGPDVRAMDLATLIYITVVRTPPDRRWPVLHALCAGYRSVLSLDPTEIGAVPSLILRHAAISFGHWTGRWRQGLSPIDDARERARRIARLATWLSDEGPRLVAVASGAHKVKPK